jgi:hypothetical protein
VLSRLEWAADVVELQQLSYRYAISGDMKDPEGMAALFVEGAQLGKHSFSRAKLAERFADSFRTSPICILNVGNTLIDLDPADPDLATGTVYCRCEAEWEGKWLVQQICYLDQYVRDAGRWRFAQRDHMLFYGAELGQSPIELQKSDARELTDGRGSMPQLWPAYQRFWERYPDAKHY